MQAGESLSFISIPEELAVKEVQPEVEREAVAEEFGYIYQALQGRYGDTFRSIETMEEDGLVTVREGSFQLLFSDESYLHLVSYSRSDEKGLLDIGLSIAEHANDGTYIGGYLYELSAGEHVRYSYHKGADDEDEIEQRFHFSVIEMHQQNELLFQMQLSEDEAIRGLAEIAWQEVEEAVTLGIMERELGFSLSSPTVEDMQKLSALVDLVSPFEAPQS